MKIPDIIKQAARDLRNNSTPSEIMLWNNIKRELLNYKFLRQKPIYVYTENSWLDRYIIADFYCHKEKLVLEIDWSIHDAAEVLTIDLYKEELLQKHNITVLRITNNDIRQNITSVLTKITKHLQQQRN